ncbi:hypothetical protein LB524_16670 [Mesorhizobium sp. ESP6-5]|nr:MULTISPECIES: hypothetical protein [unclassified Mesorhizobium]MBZ9683866.1 hypothetical protein [Mesorhizobium sp. CO1-1-2]MBZ9696602.1 hypothetical protein [Mesorhizobium sp. CO1-1-9]MBZ9725407.1 hypothetical protein [Mesorhizobium sp. CO1-1-11]MBZ9756926.1 hypothetical protein [Mesorhizobium sp. ESP6-5]MBZ9923658.1 hypothetical protein [Mesorhizobium sp. BR1-1-4]
MQKHIDKFIRGGSGAPVECGLIAALIGLEVSRLDLNQITATKPAVDG